MMVHSRVSRVMLTATVALGCAVALSACTQGGSGGGDRGGSPAAEGRGGSTTRPAGPANPGGPGGEPPTAQSMSYQGTLRGGNVAQGGETTGWILAGDGAVGGIMVDVSRVEADAKRFDGKRVKITGRMTDRTWPESGPVRVLVAERIEAAPAPQR